MATRLEMRQKVLRLLGDEAGAAFSADLINDGLDDALDAILPWCHKTAKLTYEGDGETVAFDLPADFYRVVGVWDSESGIWLPEGSISSGRAPGQWVEVNNDWILFPEGKITLANAIDALETAVLHYGAFWTKPTQDSSVFESPQWTHSALIFYAASYCITKDATQAANVRQWNLNVDSGNPVHNPMKDMAVYLLERFTWVMQSHGGRTKGVH